MIKGDTLIRVNMAVTENRQYQELDSTVAQPDILVRQEAKRQRWLSVAEYWA